MAWHRNIHVWFFSYLKQIFKSKPDFDGSLHIMIGIMDHFEPLAGNVSLAEAHKRLDFWDEKLPDIADKLRDSYGNSYKHSIFYPIEEYEESVLERISEWQSKKLVETEFHLHHDNDNEKNFLETIEYYKKIFSQEHNLLPRETRSNEIKYGFIHGNWALNNSGANGKWCGLNNELFLLKKSGCYADFTLPSAPDISQTKKINSIYYANVNNFIPKCHDSGIDAEVGKVHDDKLLLIQGPLAIRFKRDKFLIKPKIESGEIGVKTHPTLERFKVWVEQHIHVKGKPEWIFIKLFSHGGPTYNAEILLGDPMLKFFDELREFLDYHPSIKLHFVTAREMANIVKAAEDNQPGDPEEYRNYKLILNE